MPHKLTTEEFIKRAKIIHHNKYDYSKSMYVNSNAKICIICPEHGEFWQRPSDHIKGCGCIKCGINKTHNKQKYTTDSFIEKSNLIHGNKYDYSKTNYINEQTKVCIICHEKDENGIEHGEFWQRPYSHLQHHICPKCSNRYNYTTNEFIEIAKKIHDNVYNYSKVKYKNANTKICIICPVHGAFWQTPTNHLSGNGCPKCVGKYKNTKEFIIESNIIHNNKYDYSKVNYIDSKTKVCIICPKHGEFFMKPNDHLSGKGCKQCAILKTIEKNTYSTEKFIKKAQIVHGNKYDYSKTNYISHNKKICVTCPIHGEFWQIASYHLYGNGCPKCNQSHLENEIELLLKQNNIVFEYQKKIKWLKLMSLDFYLPNYNIAIECQGLQHFKAIDYFGGKEKYKKSLERDERKRELCNSNGVKLLYYSNLGIKYPYNVFEDKNELLKEITKCHIN